MCAQDVVIDDGIEVHVVSREQELSWDDMGKPEEAVARGAALRVATILGMFQHDFHLCIHVSECVSVYVCVAVCA